jgi:ethanolamine transporter EutH
MSALDKSAVSTIALTIAHQIDAAYWHEWDMFGLPGGIQFYNAINIAIFVAVIAAAVPLFRRSQRGYACSLAIAAAAALILPIHAGFALAGYTQFQLPVSIAIIVGSFAAALLQAWLTYRARNEFAAV